MNIVKFLLILLFLQLIACSSSDSNAQVARNSNNSVNNNISVGLIAPGYPGIVVPYANRFVFSPYMFTGDYAPYNPMTTALSSAWPLNTPTTTALSSMPAKLQTLTWAFSIGNCGVETWQGGFTGAQFATSNVSSFVTAGKKYIVSAGGAGNTFNCSSNANMLTYLSTYNSANMIGADFDIEGASSGGNFSGTVSNLNLTYTSGTIPSIGTALITALCPAGTVIVGGSNPNWVLNQTGCTNGTYFGSLGVAYSMAQVNSLVQTLVNAQNTSYPNLRFSFTVGGYGGSAPELSLGSYGVYVFNAINTYGLKNYTINVMAFDSINDSAHCIQRSDLTGCDNGASGVQAANNINSWYGLPYSNIEITTMIGTDDTTINTFTVPNIATLSASAMANGWAGIHFWAFSRDRDCPSATAINTKCNSYGTAGTLGFTNGFLTSLKF